MIRAMSPRRHDRRDLERIADQAMRDRGLLPTYSAAVQEEVSDLDGPARDDTVRDLRSLLWCSIDNDDSRDIDQLTFAERLDHESDEHGERTRVLVAIADVDSLVRKAARSTATRARTPPRSTPPPSSTPCCRSGSPATSPR